MMKSKTDYETRPLDELPLKRNCRWTGLWEALLAAVDQQRAVIVKPDSDESLRALKNKIAGSILSRIKKRSAPYCFHGREIASENAVAIWLELVVSKKAQESS